MARFDTQLELEWIDGQTWRLTSDFAYETDVGTLGRIVVPASFVTDFASIPRVLWTVLPPTGAYGRAAVIHDRLYRTPSVATRAEADRVLYEAMGLCDVSWLTRHVIYAGVRLRGGAAWAREVAT